MTHLHNILFLFFAFLFVPMASAQSNEETEGNGDTSLQGSFEEMKKKAGNYEDFKVIKISKLDAFWKEVTDTLTSHRESQTQARQQVETLKQEMQQNQEKLQEQDEWVKQQQYQIDHLSVLGASMKKTAYVALSLTVVALLMVIMGMGYTRYRRHLFVANVKQRDFEDLEAEFMDFKNRSREKEMKLRRELQTEINRVEELNQEIANLKSKRG